MEAKLSRRLRAIAALVTPGQRLADVGCDHAYLPIELVRTGRIPSALAMDVKEGPLERARTHIVEAGLTDRIETRLSDGLEALGEDEADTVLLAGMGGLLICRILTDRPMPESVTELVLAPQSEAADVRRRIRVLGFTLVDEDMVLEDGKYYPLLKARRDHGFPTVSKEEAKAVSPTVAEGETEVVSPATEERTETIPRDLADAFGPILLKKRHPVLHQWLLKELDTTEAILHHLRDVTQGLPPRDTLRNRENELEEKRNLIQLALTYYQ